MDYNPNLPIYLQIMHILKTKMASGELNGGDKLNSVRDLAIEFSVNPNTMQKALSELEREGLLYSERTAGRFMTTEKERINAVREEMASESIARFFEQMKAIGYSKDEIVQKLAEYEEDAQ